jgi:hypothetical protein
LAISLSYIAPISAMQKLRIVTIRFGTARKKLALERWTHPKPQRRKCSPLYEVPSCRGKSAGVAKRPREHYPPKIPHGTIRNFSITLSHKTLPPPCTRRGALWGFRWSFTHRVGWRVQPSVVHCAGRERVGSPARSHAARVVCVAFALRCCGLRETPMTAGHAVLSNTLALEPMHDPWR